MISVGSPHSSVKIAKNKYENLVLKKYSQKNHDFTEKELNMVVSSFLICLIGIPAILLPIATIILLAMIFVRVRNIEEKLNQR